MTEIAVPDTIPDNIMELGVSDLTAEEITGDTPCEINGKFFNKCQSNGLGRAEWMVTHNGGQPKCTFLICEACVIHLQSWLAKMIVTTGAHGFGCNMCEERNMHYREFIFRHI